jgi:hypothetical protein
MMQNEVTSGGVMRWSQQLLICYLKIIKFVRTSP